MKIAIITDTHFGAKQDSLIFQKHIENFYHERFFPFLRKHNIKNVFHLGDIFDRRRYINFRTLSDFRKTFLKYFENDPSLNLYAIIGNHDVFYKNTNDLNSPELLFPALDNINLYREPETISLDGKKILLVPWINEENEKDSFDLIENSDANVCFGHFEISGFSMYKGYESSDGISMDVFKNFEMVLSGHYHTKSKRGNIHYLGTPYQITWNDYGDRRGFHVYDTDNGKLQFIENKNNLFEKVYYNDVKNDYNKFDASSLRGKYVKIVVEKKNDFNMYDSFLDRVTMEDTNNLSILEDFSMSEYNMDDDVNVEDTSEILNNYVDNMTVDDSKKEKIKESLMSLYVESVNNMG